MKNLVLFVFSERCVEAMKVRRFVESSNPTIGRQFELLQIAFELVERCVDLIVIYWHVCRPSSCIWSICGRFSCSSKRF